MALAEVSQSVNTTYLTISEGFIVSRAKTHLSGYEPYTRKDGSIGYQRKYASVDGYLTKVELRQTDFGKRWAFTLADAGQNQQLELPYDSVYAKYIILALANDACDYTQAITVKPYYYIPKGKDKHSKGVTLAQNAVKVPWKYERDDLPKWNEITLKGQKTWDNSDELAFLENVVSKDILPRIQPLPF